VLHLNEQQVRDLADADGVIDAIRAAFARDSSSTLRMPPRSSVPLADDGVLLVMPCYDSALGAAGVKLVSVSGQAGVNASYELIDPRTGIALARLEANYLTDLRTAATSALATDLLARPDAETLGVFGTGREAMTHIAVLPRVRRFRRILVCGSRRSDVSAFCVKIKASLPQQGIEIAAADSETCVRQADVICTCTNSPAPLFDGRWLEPGVHLNLVGAFQPHTREVDEETVSRSRVVVDTYGGALSEAGDLLIPLSHGTITRDHVLADLHEIASGKKQPRTGREDITLFKSVGCALEDLVTAKLIFDRAKGAN
jgi:alanine dehydrogenase